MSNHFPDAMKKVCDNCIHFILHENDRPNGFCTHHFAETKESDSCEQQDPIPELLIER